MKLGQTRFDMPVEIGGSLYFSATEVAKDVGVSRSTLWRWRQNRKIPVGQRYRGRQVLFSQAELDAVREYAQRIEPIQLGPVEQLRLFNSSRSGDKS